MLAEAAGADMEACHYVDAQTHFSNVAHESSDPLLSGPRIPLESWDWSAEPLGLCRLLFQVAGERPAGGRQLQNRRDVGELGIDLRKDVAERLSRRSCQTMISLREPFAVVPGCVVNARCERR